MNSISAKYMREQWALVMMGGGYQVTEQFPAVIDSNTNNI